MHCTLMYHNDMQKSLLLFLLEKSDSSSERSHQEETSRKNGRHKSDVTARKNQKEAGETEEVEIDLQTFNKEYNSADENFSDGVNSLKFQ